MMTGIKTISQAALLIISSVCGLAAPGEVDAVFFPQLDREVPPGSVILAPDGKILLGAVWEGFDRIDGQPTGDRVLLLPDGTPAGQPVPDLLEPVSGFPIVDGNVIGDRTDWFPLGPDRWLVPVEATGGWLLVDGAAPPQPFFTDVPAGQRIRPQFIGEGRLRVVRTSASGQRTVEVRNVSDGTVDPSFQQASDWPAPPVQCVPAAGGGAWILGGDMPPFIVNPGGWPDGPKFNHVFRIHASGAVDATIPARTFNHYRTPRLGAAAAGGYHVHSGLDRTSLNLWPRPDTVANHIEWFDHLGAPDRSVMIVSPVYSTFLWADAGDGRVIATGADRRLRRFFGDGTADTTFTSPGGVSSLISLPDGKWLIDGTRRLLPDGQPDPAWHTPRLTAPAQPTAIHPLADGRMLISGSISRAGATPASDIAILHPDGTADPSFTADPRVKQPQHLTVSGGSIYIVTPEIVTLQGGGTTTLIKLGMDGSIDESFNPTPATQLYLRRFTRVFPQPDGTIIAEGTGGYEVTSTHLFRLDATGAVLHRFLQPTSGFPQPAVAVQTGGLVVGSSFFSAAGLLVREVGGHSAVQPVCQWQGGILFAEETGGTPAMLRLRLWKGGRWDRGFSAPPIRQSSGVIRAVAGPGEALYLTAAWDDGTQVLRRMLADGSIDPTFTAPGFTQVHRRDAAAWKIAGAAGPEAYDPGVTLRTIRPADWAVHPATSTLWIGGGFTQASGMHRDGLARLETSPIPPVSGPARTAYASWSLGMRLGSSGPDDDPDGDGIPNSLEFLFGTDPRIPSAGVEVSADETDFIFSHLLSGEAIDATRTIEYSGDLEEWTAADEETDAFSTTQVAGDIVRISLAIPRAGRDRLFFRLRATIP